MTTILPFEWSTPIPVFLYPYSSSNLEEAHLQKHFTDTYGYTTQVINTHQTGYVHESSTLTTVNIWTSNVHLWRWHPTIEALLLPETSAPAKCTHRAGTIQLNANEDGKLSLNWIELIATIHCAAWGAFTVKDPRTSTDHLRWQWLQWLQWLQWQWWSQSTSIMDNRSSPTTWMLFDCY